MRVSQRGNLGRKEIGHTIVMLCVRRQNPPHTIAALFRRTFQFTNALCLLTSDRAPISTFATRDLVAKVGVGARSGFIL